MALQQHLANIYTITEKSLAFLELVLKDQQNQLLRRLEVVEQLQTKNNQLCTDIYNQLIGEPELANHVTIPIGSTTTTTRGEDSDGRKKGDVRDKNGHGTVVQSGFETDPTYVQGSSGGQTDGMDEGECGGRDGEREGEMEDERHDGENGYLEGEGEEEEYNAERSGYRNGEGLEEERHEGEEVGEEGRGEEDKSLVSGECETGNGVIIKNEDVIKEEY